MIARLVALLLLSGGAVAAAQTPARVVQGTVTDSIGAPLVRATVMIPDTKLVSLTDSTGHYRFNEVPTTPFSIRAVASGFRPKQVDKIVYGTMPMIIDFVLYPFIEEPFRPAAAASRLPR